MRKEHKLDIVLITAILLLMVFLVVAIISVIWKMDKQVAVDDPNANQMRGITISSEQVIGE